jgi:hypothetical protein
VISLGPSETDNINQMITLTEESLCLPDCKNSQKGLGNLRKIYNI